MELQVPVLALAYGADLLVGDPPWFPHPVRGMGLAIQWGERLLRRFIPWERLAGVLLAVGLVGMCYAGTRWVVQILATSSAWWAVAAEVILLFSCLSTRDLAQESAAVLAALEAKDLPLARRRVARIVGRDTDTLDQPAIVRATIETIAESAMDGILSPLFFFLVGGVPLAVAYKAVNTLDSMIGHRSARYLRFGWAAATLDTWANWLPARWSVFAFTVAAWLMGFRARAAWRCGWSPHLSGPPQAGPASRSASQIRAASGSPRQVGGNSALPEAAMAGALGVRLGGANRYGDRVVETPCMGQPLRPLDPPRVREAIRLMSVTSVTAWLMTMTVLIIRTRW